MSRSRPSSILLTSILALLVLAACLALTSCAGQRLGRDKTGPATTGRPSETELEAIPAPVSPQRRTPAAREESLPYVEEEEPPRVEESSAVPSYRVQIFASSSMEKAEAVAAQARTVFSERVYVEYSAPLYRVRMGDFSTKEQALALKDRAVEAGYDGAWVAEVNPSGQ